MVRRLPVLWLELTLVPHLSSISILIRSTSWGGPFLLVIFRRWLELLLDRLVVVGSGVVLSHFGSTLRWWRVSWQGKLLTGDASLSRSRVRLLQMSASSWSATDDLVVLVDVSVYIVFDSLFLSLDISLLFVLHSLWFWCLNLVHSNLRLWLVQHTRESFGQFIFVGKGHSENVLHFGFVVVFPAFYNLVHFLIDLFNVASLFGEHLHFFEDSVQDFESRLDLSGVLGTLQTLAQMCADFGVHIEAVLCLILLKVDDIVPSKSHAET